MCHNVAYHTPIGRRRRGPAGKVWPNPGVVRMPITPKASGDERGAAHMQRDHEVYYHTLYRVACMVNSSLNLQRTLEAVVKSIVEAMDARACALRLLDRKGEVLELVASVGLSERYLHKGLVEVSAS